MSDTLNTPESASTPEGTNTSDGAEMPDSAGTRDSAGTPDSAGMPDSAGTTEILNLSDTPASAELNPAATKPMPVAYRTSTLTVGTPNTLSMPSTVSMPSTRSTLSTPSSPLTLNTLSVGDTKIPAPRIRVGAIVWGLIVSALATAFLVVTSTPERRIAVAHWINSLDSETLVLLGLLAVGVLIVLLALVSAVHRAQRRAAR